MNAGGLSLARWTASMGASLLLVARLAAAELPGAGEWPDAWLEPVPEPAGLPVVPGVTGGIFSGLGAESLGDELQVRWLPAEPVAIAGATLWYSWGRPGHWPARDWRRISMRPRGRAWGVTLPVEDPDRPLVYALAVTGPGGTNVSAFRVASPRAVGIRQPTSLFWPFLEGFEEGTTGWRWLGTAPAGGLIATNPARTGHQALRVRIPDATNTARIATTRVRDWHFIDQGAAGITFQARTLAGRGSLNVVMHGNWGQPGAVASVATNQVELGPMWQRVDVWTNQFPAAPLKHVDLIGFSFRGEPGQEFLLDDLQLLGPWPVD